MLLEVLKFITRKVRLSSTTCCSTYRLRIVNRQSLALVVDYNTLGHDGLDKERLEAIPLESRSKVSVKPPVVFEAWTAGLESLDSLLSLVINLDRFYLVLSCGLLELEVQDAYQTYYLRFAVYSASWLLVEVVNRS